MSKASDEFIKRKLMDLYYSPEQISVMLSVHRKTVLRWIDGGDLEAVKLEPKIVRVSSRALSLFLEKHQQPVTA